MAIFCLFFIAISGVSASDALDMSNNPDNSNILSDSIDSESEESIGNSYADQLSNEATSSLGASASDASNDASSTLTEGEEDNSHEAIFEDSNSSSSTVKTATSITVSKTKIYSGTPIVITLKDKNGKVLSGKKVQISVPSKKKSFYYDHQLKRTGKD